MEASEVMLWAGVAGAALGVALLRYAWSLPRRSAAWNGAGWTALGGAAGLAAAAEGAWGLSVAALAAMTAAFVALALAGIRSPRGRTKASSRRAGMLPESGEPRRIGRRVITFLLTIVGGLTVSIGLGLAMRWLGDLLGWSEANASVAALYTVPVAWALLVFALLMQEKRRSQLLTLLACCVPALPMLASGVLQ